MPATFAKKLTRRESAGVGERITGAPIYRCAAEPLLIAVAMGANSHSSRIILLHGASSSGKSTLSEAIQRALDEPFLHFASDHLALGLPERREPEGPFQWWGNVRPRFFDGFQRCIATLAAAGNDLIVDHVIEFPEWRADLSLLLRPFDVFLVAVHCSLAEIDRRERSRGDRKIGEGRSHIEDDRIHDFGPSDCEVDTTGRPPTEVALEVIRRWRQRSVSVLFD
jgi:chloramphenicol 3-O phosphotransferase